MTCHRCHNMGHFAGYDKLGKTLAAKDFLCNCKYGNLHQAGNHQARLLTEFDPIKHSSYVSEWHKDIEQVWDQIRNNRTKKKAK